jgi:hypothetical protein
VQHETNGIRQKRRGGRPPIPPAPQNSADVRTLIAQETVKTKPRVRTLRSLYRLLKVFVAAEDAARVEAKTRALEDQNRLKAEELELRRAEYRRRHALGEQTKALKQSQQVRG